MPEFATEEELLAQMRTIPTDGDREGIHQAADRLLCRLVVLLAQRLDKEYGQGEGDTARAILAEYNRIQKWYA